MYCLYGAKYVVEIHEETDDERKKIHTSFLADINKDTTDLVQFWLIYKRDCFDLLPNKDAIKSSKAASKSYMNHSDAHIK